MMTRDLHTHSTFSDGINTPEEIVLSAIEKGLKTIGISDHSYTSFDTYGCMPPERTEEYIVEIQRLKEKYHDKIEILCGIEQDIFSGVPKHKFDYVIGSVHFIKLGEEYIAVDLSAKDLKDAADKYFNGDIYGVVKEYYHLVGKVHEVTGANIIGHLDLITKFQEKEPLFDERDERYISAWQSAVDELIKADVVFEINTGAVSHGYRTTPYPSPAIKEYILKNGGSFVYNSDSHSADAVANFKDL